MSSYSLGGYAVAVLTRSSKTILVEGKSDRVVLKRFLLQAAENDHAFMSPVIDTVDLIRGEDLSGLGAREKVKRVLQEAGDSRGKLAGLMDREWDDFCIDQLCTVSELSSQEPLFVTTGHSIENYFFECEVCLKVLRMRFAEHLDREKLEMVRASFPAALTFALGYSLAAARAQLLGRLEGLLAPSDVSWDGSAFALEPAYVQKMMARGVSLEVAEELRNFVSASSSDPVVAGLGTSDKRRRAHGHLGEGALWCSIARVFAAAGLPEQAVEAIGLGHRDDRLKASADFAAEDPDIEVISVSQLVHWCSSAC